MSQDQNLKDKDLKNVAGGGGVLPQTRVRTVVPSHGIAPEQAQGSKEMGEGDLKNVAGGGDAVGVRPQTRVRTVVPSHGIVPAPAQGSKVPAAAPIEEGFDIEGSVDLEKL